MIRITTQRYDVYAIGDNAIPAVYIEGFCASGDTKPTEIDGSPIASGSTITEVDTGGVYFYDEDSSDWTLQFTLQASE